LSTALLWLALVSANRSALKIILSRKGFDSSAGGVASPIFPDGSLLSLPIPEQQSQIRYIDLMWRDHQLGRLVESLTRGRVNRRDTAHLDPDIYTDIYPRQPDWCPLFGQDGAAQSHLANQGVGIGDLFLFFGWFREVEKGRNGYRFVPKAPDQHVIYGWLQVGQIRQGNEIKVDAPSWADYHPHCRGGRGARNTLYLSTDALTLPKYVATSTAPSAGTMSHLRDPQILTAPHSLRTAWRLPRWFFPSDRPPLTYHNDLTRWQLDDDYVYLQSAARGQEFVLDTAYYPEAVPWVRSLLGMENGRSNVQCDTLP